jgi:hypothetical protein
MAGSATTNHSSTAPKAALALRSQMPRDQPTAA